MKVKFIDRFNQGNTSFLEDFQEVMIERICLNYDKSYTKRKADKLIRNILKRPPETLNTKIRDGFLLSCKIEPELYLLAQETCRKTNGELMPMDELIPMLLTCFILSYHKVTRPVLPFKHKRKVLRYRNLYRFQKTFGKYYHNSVRSFQDN
jgi:hypothetical protein